MLFDKIWLKLSQALAVIEEEGPRILGSKEKLPIHTIKMFIQETRSEIYDFKEAMNYVENF